MDYCFGFKFIISDLALYLHLITFYLAISNKILFIILYTCLTDFIDTCSFLECGNLIVGPIDAIFI